MEEEEIESDIVARYEVEDFYYYPSGKMTTTTGNKPLHIKVKSATSTVGANLTGENRDRTGVMIWPATHLLCQWLADNSLLSTASSSTTAVLELGCGCGLVGVVAKKVSPEFLWVSTDMDEKALELTRQNFALNNIPNLSSWVRTLRWGDPTSTLQDDLATVRQSQYFDAIVAADIVYPSTANQVLQMLFETVDNLLCENGMFYLSFCTRDGHRTPLRLIQAASDAGFSISAVPPLDDDVKKKLPPLLDATLLFLQRDNQACIKNATLGTSDCTVFPGLQAAIQRAAEESSDEEWDPPPFLDMDGNGAEEDF